MLFFVYKISAVSINICKIYEKYAWFSEAVSIPLSICGESGQLQYSSAVRRDAFPEFLLRICVEDFRLQKRSARTPLMILLPPDWFLGIARLNTGSYLILGPAPLRSFSAEELVPACRNLLEGKSLLAFCDLLLHTPICSLRRFTISFASALTLSGVDSVSPDEISLSNDNLPVGNMEQNLHHELIQGRENSVLHVTEHYENELFSSVEAGDVALLKRIVMQPLGGTPGKLSRDLLRQARYTFVVVATNATRAAIRGGASRGACFFSKRSLLSADGYHEECLRHSDVKHADAPRFHAEGGRSEEKRWLLPADSPLYYIYSRTSP